MICRETSACSPATESVEPGWTGASFASGGAALLATARRYSRVVRLDTTREGRSGPTHNTARGSPILFLRLLCAERRAALSQLDLYDGDMHVRSVLTVGHPTAVQFMCGPRRPT